jgi:hypothetical protein
MRGIFCLIVFLVLIGCSDKPSPPSDLIPGKKMQNLMWDMVQADRFASTYILRDSLRLNVKDETFKVYDQVFQLHNVTKDQFVKSYKYYLSRPDLGKEIFDSVAAKANRARAENNKPVLTKP